MWRREKREGSEYEEKIRGREERMKDRMRERKEKGEEEKES